MRAANALVSICYWAGEHESSMLERVGIISKIHVLGRIILFYEYLPQIYHIIKIAMLGVFSW